MVDTHFKSEQNQFLHLDTEKILSAPPYILLALKYINKLQSSKKFQKQNKQSIVN